MIVEGFYKLLALIDYLVFKLASTLISVNIDIAGREIFDVDRINEIASRIYVVIGVVMLFKIVISAIQFMVNPDGFDDKEKGFGGILKKTIISLALMVLMPALFDFMMAMQTTIIKTIPKIVFGNQAGMYYRSDSTNGTASSEVDKTSDKMVFTVLSSFITENKNNPGGSVGEEGTNAIHDLETFRDRAADGCNDGIVGNAGKCKYNYMIIISTLCGGFLCYVLLSMTLDVAIRSIKFSIIRMLAPIPISGYIFSKDKLTNFFKTVLTVYFDLFIRLAVIFLIIFGVKEITVSTPGSPNLLTRIAGDNASWFRNAIVTIAIIGGLFLFAKNAPKFITDLLGIKDIGSGDMKEMFKPGRLTGLARAVTNPLYNAGSNYRKAMAANDDMGGKARRRINALRHAVGGAARGAVDGAAGLVAGDDWAKIRQRHDKSVAKSAKRSAMNYMKRTSKIDARDRTKEMEAKRQAYADYLAGEGLEVEDMLGQHQSAAATNYANHMSNLQNRINTLNKKLYDGVALTDAEKQELSSKQAEFSRLSTEAGKASWIKNETDNITARRMASNKVMELRDQHSRNATEITALRTTINSGRDATGRVLSQEELAERRARVVALEQQNATLKHSFDTQEGREALLKEAYASIKKYHDTEDALAKFDKDNEKQLIVDSSGNVIGIKNQKPVISNKSIISGKLDKAFGGEGFTGQGYVDTADLLKNNRSSLYTGEAMTKMRQNADILVDADGVTPHQFDIKFTIRDVKYSYAEMADIKRRVDNGTLTDTADLEALGFANSAMVQSAFEDMEKQAAEAYVQANMAAADPNVKSDIKLKGGAAPNSTIVEGIKRMKAALASANISKEERDDLLDRLSTNPGKFFKGASDEQERMRTKGSRISAYNSGKKES